MCPHATFFHTPLWMNLATRSYPHYRNVSASFAIDSDMYVVLPLLETKRELLGLSRQLASSFAGCYGGFIATGDISMEEGTAMMEQVLRRNVSRMRITGNPFDPAVREYGGAEVSEDFTHVLRLGDFDAVFSNFSKGHKSSAIQGRRYGISTRVATELNDYQTYYKLYEDSLARWGDRVTSRYPWKLFENLFCMSLEYPDEVKLWVAELDGRMIAGGVVFYWNAHVVYWHGAARSDGMKYRPANVLVTEMIKDACAKRFSFFDFNPSGGHEGVAAFKKSFGTERLSFQRREYSSATSSFLTRITTAKKALAQCWGT